MALTDKLRNLDQRVLPGTREPDEDAETYLRRVASSRAISPAQSGDVMAALREHLGVEAGGAAEGEAEDSEGDEAEGDAAEGDEAEDQASEESSSEDDDEKDDDEKDDEKKDDDGS